MFNHADIILQPCGFFTSQAKYQENLEKSDRKYIEDSKGDAAPNEKFQQLLHKPKKLGDLYTFAQLLAIVGASNLDPQNAKSDERAFVFKLLENFYLSTPLPSHDSKVSLLIQLAFDESVDTKEARPAVAKGQNKLKQLIQKHPHEFFAMCPKAVFSNLNNNTLRALFAGNHEDFPNFPHELLDFIEKTPDPIKFLQTYAEFLSGALILQCLPALLANLLVVPKDVENYLDNGNSKPIDKVRNALRTTQPGSLANQFFNNEEVHGEWNHLTTKDILYWLNKKNYAPLTSLQPYSAEVRLVEVVVSPAPSSQGVEPAVSSPQSPMQNGVTSSEDGDEKGSANDKSFSPDDNLTHHQPADLNESLDTPEEITTKTEQIVKTLDPISLIYLRAQLAIRREISQQSGGFLGRESVRIQNYLKKFLANPPLDQAKCAVIANDSRYWDYIAPKTKKFFGWFERDQAKVKAEKAELAKKSPFFAVMLEPRGGNLAHVVLSIEQAGLVHGESGKTYLQTFLSNKEFLQPNEGSCLIVAEAMNATQNTEQVVQLANYIKSTGPYASILHSTWQRKLNKMLGPQGYLEVIACVPEVAKIQDQEIQNYLMDYIQQRFKGVVERGDQANAEKYFIDFIAPFSANVRYHQAVKANLLHKLFVIRTIFGSPEMFNLLIATKDQPETVAFIQYLQHDITSELFAQFIMPFTMPERVAEIHDALINRKQPKLTAEEVFILETIIGSEHMLGHLMCSIFQRGKDWSHSANIIYLLYKQDYRPPQAWTFSFNKQSHNTAQEFARVCGAFRMEQSSQNDERELDQDEQTHDEPEAGLNATPQRMEPEQEADRLSDGSFKTPPGVGQTPQSDRQAEVKSNGSIRTPSDMGSPAASHDGSAQQSMRSGGRDLTSEFDHTSVDTHLRARQQALSPATANFALPTRAAIAQLDLGTPGSTGGNHNPSTPGNPARR